MVTYDYYYYLMNTIISQLNQIHIEYLIYFKNLQIYDYHFLSTMDILLKIYVAESFYISL